MNKTLTALTLAISTAASSAAITYTDADLNGDPSANTSVGGSAFGSTNSGDWRTRGLGAAYGNADTANFANEGNVIASSGSDGAELTTTIPSVDAGTAHEVYVFFWTADNNPNWDIQAGLTSGALTTYTAANSTLVDASTAGNISGLNVLGQGADDFSDFVDGNRLLYYASLGEVPAGATSIDVFIDDVVTGAAGDQRSWYDGVGLEPVPEPSTALLSALATLGLLRRRRS